VLGRRDISEGRPSVNGGQAIAYESTGRTRAVAAVKAEPENVLAPPPLNATCGAESLGELVSWRQLALSQYASIVHQLCLRSKVPRQGWLLGSWPPPLSRVGFPRGKAEAVAPTWTSQSLDQFA
jgi:hypothetical protein